MKNIVAAALLSVSAVASAEINNVPVVVDEPIITVRAGEQDNGVVRVDQTITDVTKGVGGGFGGGGATSSRSFSAAPSGPGAAPSSFTPTSSEEIPLPPIPEPETYALMAVGLACLLLRKKKKV